MAAENANRDAIRAYVAANPGATIRAIQEGCGLSSTSLVAHHLKALKVERFSVPQLREENARLNARVEKLERLIRKIFAGTEEALASMLTEGR